MKFRQQLLKSKPFLGVLISTSLALGCTTINPNGKFNDVQTEVSKRTGQTIIWRKEAADDEKAEEQIALLLAHSLTPEHAAQIALFNNPELQVTFEEIGISEGELIQAGLLSNPVFDAELHFTGGGIGRGTNLNIFQEFVNVLTIPIRKRVAKAQAEAVTFEVASQTLRLVLEVKKSFYLAQAALENRHLMEQISKALNVQQEIMERLHRAGNVTDREYESAKTVAAKAHLDFLQAKADAQQAREELNRLLGLKDEERDWKMKRRLPEMPTEEVPLRDLATLAAQNRLDLAREKANIAAASEQLGYTEYSKFLPEFTLGFDIEGEDNGRVLAGPNLQFPLPLFDQGQGKIQMAESKLRQAQKQYAAALNTARSEIRSATQQLRSARSRHEFAQKTYIPLAKAVTANAQLEYNGMLISVFELLAAKTQEIEAGKMYVESLRDYWLARAALEAAVGGSLLLPDKTTAKHTE